MTASSDQTVELLVRVVRDLPPLERERALDRSCHDQPALRKAVEDRLAEPASAVAAIDHRTTEFRPQQDVPESDVDARLAPGATIGRYKLLEEIGEGGFGIVFVAQQREPVKRLVALKVIKLGMDTREVIARFEVERQTLAMMDHPHIARVLDAGATALGRPYFVMELVRGEPITSYCDKKRLSVFDRLRLFQQVCRAVQHAHQKGIIHRDLKPTNVLVSTTDDEPHAKVIDFGIAKATNAELTERTLVTEFQQLVGTPVYMSPEQIERTGVDVDTRADIYSLGIVLYELLTGVTPFDKERLQSASWGDLQRMICEEEPPPMSERVSAVRLDDQRRRTSDAARLPQLLRSDLDWIVMKATDKDRRRRYGTANELSDDLDRYLRDEPVMASPPTAWYRFQKFRRRNRIPLALGSMVLGAVVMTLIVTTSFMVWALREGKRARAATERAEQEAARAERFSSLAGTTFLSAKEIADANRRWGAEIQELGTTLPATDPERVRRECLYVTWLITQAIVLHEPKLLNQSVIDIDELRERAKVVLGLQNSHFLSLANAHARSAILLQEKKPEEVIGLMDDVVASYGSVRGQDDPNYRRFVFERALAVLSAQAARPMPTADAIRVLSETAANVGVSIDPERVNSRRLWQVLQQQVDEWQVRTPNWYHSLRQISLPKPAEPAPEQPSQAQRRSDSDS